MKIQMATPIRQPGSARSARTAHTRTPATTHPALGQSCTYAPNKQDTVGSTGSRGERAGYYPEDDSPCPRGPEIADREERRAYPRQRLKSAYLAMVGDNPDVTPGDRKGAAEIVMNIERAIEKGGWTRNEWNRLRAMHVKWLLRRDGKDARFEMVGNRRGGLTANQADELKARQVIMKVRRLLSGEQSEA